MSYQVIARKWRPQTFEEVTGQEAITKTLRNAIEFDRLHHAYIFSGPRGVGKTTTARLLAKALNCHKTDKPNPTPCASDDPNACASCKEIAESRSMDVLEFDAASHTGVDDVRELILESININPARDRYKVFIIDEVHMLSKSSFNALLKTLEEPPPRIAFVMATTELHKLPDTILSRCQEFQFRTISLPKIYNRLKTIAESENIKVSDEALREIARSGEGSMRDAQSNFDQVISFSGDEIGTDEVIISLGIAGAEMLTRTLSAIAENNPVEVLNVVDELISRGQDLRNFCRDFLAFCRDLMVIKLTGETENLLDAAVLSQEELKKYAEPFTNSDFIRFFNSLSETETKLRDANEPRYVLEIGLIKLIEMRRVMPIEKLLERIASLEKVLANGDFSSIKNSESQNDQIENNVKEPEKIVEKKTLETDVPREEIPFPISAKPSPENFAEEIPPKVEFAEVPEEPPFEIQNYEEPPDFEPFEQNQNFSDAKLSFNPNEMPVKMIPISEEELEHVEDDWLDDAYELKLQLAGDNLMPIKNGSKILEIVLGESVENQISAQIDISSGNGTAAARAKEKTEPIFVPPGFDIEEENGEIPVLPENPTDEEMRIYAESHPLVKKIIRIFRGNIVEIKKL